MFCGMNNKVKLYICLAALILVSCGKNGEVAEEQHGVRVVAGGYYAGWYEGFDTKANCPDHDLPYVPKGPIPMPEGSTLYLMIEEWDVDAWKISEKYPMKPYVVGGASSLYPCEVYDDGTVIPGSSGSPLMLTNGRYRFHAVSPARKLETVVANGTTYHNVMKIKNGDYVIASDTRWHDTYPTDVAVEIDPSSPMMQEVELNPLIHQTAQMKFYIKKGRNVSSLDVLPDGVSISGIQDDTKDGISFHWSTDESLLPMKVGDKYHGVTIREWKEIEEDGEEYLVGEAAILPTDASTNAVFIVFNLRVNDVPTQYMMSLHQQYYKSSYSYEYRFKVDVEDGITVAVWDNITHVIGGDKGDFTNPGTIDYTEN